MRTLSLLPSSPKYPTASELHRARECVAPWALGLPEVRETNEWAEFGRRMHWGAQLLAEGQGMIEALSRALPEPDAGYTSQLAKMLEHVEPMIERDLLECKQGADGVWHVEKGIKWRPGVLEDEVALCERQPGERLRGWFAGTADLVYVRHDNLLVVADWKFGPREHVNGEPAKESCQGFFLALAFATLLEVRGSSAGVVVARFERRMVSEDGVEVDGYDITQGDLDGFAEQLRGLASRIDKAEGAMPKISAACGKCKAKAECPAWQATYLGLVESWRDGVKDLTAPPENADVAARMHHASTMAENLVTQWREWVKAYVTIRGPVSIGLGLELKAVPSKDREVVDTPEGLDVIERIIPGGVVFERKAGIGTIEKAISTNVDKAKAGTTSPSDKKKTKKAETERVFSELTTAGAVIDKGKKLTVRVVRSDEKEW